MTKLTDITKADWAETMATAADKACDPDMPDQWWDLWIGDEYAEITIIRRGNEYRVEGDMIIDGITTLEEAKRQALSYC